MKYLLVAMIFLSCHNIPGHNDAVIKSTETLDTIKTNSTTMNAMPLLFETAFMKGMTVQVKNGTANLYGITIGKIKITSGKIVACDPLHIDEYGKPYTQEFSKGEFPVQLSIARFENEETVAFARINFTEEPVARWELALLDGQNSIPVGDKEIHGYGVDASVGIFMDQDGIQSLDTKRIWDLEGDHELFKEMDKHYHGGWRYAMYNFGQYNLAAFSSGAGDGRYASYIGFDTKGMPCRLLTDFNLFDWSKK